MTDNAALQVYLMCTDSQLSSILKKCRPSFSVENERYTKELTTNLYAKDILGNLAENSVQGARGKQSINTSKIPRYTTMKSRKRSSSIDNIDSTAVACRLSEKKARQDNYQCCKFSILEKNRSKILEVN